MKGTILQYNTTRGFGFIRCDETKGDVFFHFSRVIDEFDRSALGPGTRVEFSEAEGRLPGRKMAVDIRITDD
ncbi:MAG: cold shock domain-containing protein [Candidatus Binataceae bacterium]|jgi:cold shock CspA family protein